jgi:hypothetical protein
MPTTPQTHVPGIRKWSNAHLLDPSLACEFYTMFNASSLNLCNRKLTCYRQKIYLTLKEL